VHLDQDLSASLRRALQQLPLPAVAIKSQRTQRDHGREAVEGLIALQRVLEAPSTCYLTRVAGAADEDPRQRDEKTAERHKTSDSLTCSGWKMAMSRATLLELGARCT